MNTYKIPSTISDEFFEKAYTLHQKPSYKTYDRLKSCMSSFYPELNSVSLESFRSECKKHFSLIRAKQANKSVARRDESNTHTHEIECWQGWENAKKVSWINVRGNMNSYFYRHVQEGERQRNGPWNDEETGKLVETIIAGVEASKSDYIINSTCIRWGILSLLINGRCGYQCKAKYNSLVATNRLMSIEILLKVKKPRTFEKFTQPALLPNQAIRLAEAIKSMIYDRKLVTPCNISKMAIELYNQPEHLAEKAAIIE